MSERLAKFSKLAEYLRGTLAESERLQLEDELRRDPDLAELLRFLQDLRRENAEAEWDILKASAHSLVARQLKELKNMQGAAGEIRGVTVFDSQLMPMPEGLRPATVDTRYIRYKLGSNALELALYPVSPDSFEMIGQLVGFEKIEACEVEARGESNNMMATVNGVGIFRLARVARGVYQLVISCAGRRLATVDMEL